MRRRRTRARLSQNDDLMPRGGGKDEAERDNWLIPCIGLRIDSIKTCSGAIIGGANGTKICEATDLDANNASSNITSLFPSCAVNPFFHRWGTRSECGDGCISRHLQRYPRHLQGIMSQGQTRDSITISHSGDSAKRPASHEQSAE
nr:hypothetical protein CFP56_30122 [Quercus suber]